MSSSEPDKRTPKKARSFRIKNTSIVKSPLDKKWVISITLITFAITMILSIVASDVLSHVGLIPAFLILFGFVGLGIVFDLLGVATASADEKPFHSMSSKRVKGADQAVWLIRNAEKVSSFCNDVIGDICGIVSGVAISLVVVYVLLTMPLLNASLTSLSITGLVAAITVGGKAVGKTFARNHSNSIVYAAALLVYFLTNWRKKPGKGDN